ncbi:MAG: hypothetical protein WC693_02415 [Patescibacteria group bacterium]
MRRLLPFVALLMMGIMMVPLIANATDAFYVNPTTIITATIPTTTAAPDANIGALGHGTAMLTANNIGVTMPANTTDVPVTYSCLRAKGSGHSAGVSLGSASALASENSYTYLIEMTGTCHDATANPAATAGASGTCTWHPLRC